MGFLNSRNIIRIGGLVGWINPPYTLPTSPVDSIILDYSGLNLDATDTDILLNALFNDGFCTNCVIDVTGNTIPTAASAAARTGLEAAGNILILDSV